MSRTGLQALPKPYPSMQSRRTFTLTLSLLRREREKAKLRWHRVRVSEQGSKAVALQLSSPRSAQGDQGEGLFRPLVYS